MRLSIVDCGLWRLPASLANLKLLKEVVLHDNEIRWISPALRGAWPHIEQIDLRHNKLYDHGANHTVICSGTREIFDWICDDFRDAHAACTEAAVATMVCARRKGACRDLAKLLGRAVLNTQWKGSGFWRILHNVKRARNK